MDIPSLNLSLQSALTAIGATEELAQRASFELAPLEHADLTCAASFALAKTLQQSPRQVAERIVEELQKDSKALVGVEKIEVVGTGYINLTWSDKNLWAMAGEAHRAMRTEGKQKTVIVEYSSPNVAKPLGIGHIRSTIIGEALARIHEFVGERVVRLNHPGDWGTQFGKLIVMIQDEWGGVVSDDRTIRDFVGIYVQFHERAKNDPALEDRARKETVKLQARDPSAIKIWEAICKKSYQEFDRLYQRLGIHFDEIRGESAYEQELPKIVARLLDAGVAQRSEGAVIIPMPGLPSPMMIQKSDGAYLYATTDLAALEYRIKKYHPEEILYVVGSQQTLHFQQLRRVAQTLGLASTDQTQHVAFGMLLGENHKKLSTREGSSIELESVLDETVSRARAIIQARPDANTWDPKELDAAAMIIGTGAVKYNDLSQNRIHDVVLSWDRMLALTGNSAPYLQYCVVRIQRILDQARLSSVQKQFPANEALHPREQELMRCVVRLPMIVSIAAATNEPHRIADYLFDLASRFHRFYEEVPVLQAPEQSKQFRLQLIDVTAHVITKGLELLGIEIPRRM